MELLERQQAQLTLDSIGLEVEDPGYLSNQLITYIGNKRALLGPLEQALNQVKRRLGRNHLRIFDAFSGSGVVSRFFKAHSSLLVSNDLEHYAWVIADCYLKNRSEVDREELQSLVDHLNETVEDAPYETGFIERMYSPRDEANITKEDRAFYTRNNARRIDNYRRMIANLSADLQPLLLGPLLSRASIHANTAGVFKGFYKSTDTGVGMYGGKGADALHRILGAIVMEAPVLSRFECEVVATQRDANELARELTDMDLAYFDPPYNQHPYGSNYFMLNLIAKYRRPQNISRVSGIPTDWTRSGYNVRTRAFQLFENILKTTDARFLLISYNSEGFIPFDAMEWLLGTLGHVHTIDIPYNTFRGSRNLRERPIHVTERLFLVERT